MTLVKIQRQTCLNYVIIYFRTLFEAAAGEPCYLRRVFVNITIFGSPTEQTLPQINRGLRNFRKAKNLDSDVNNQFTLFISFVNSRWLN